MHKTVILVDDDALFRAMMRRHLQHLGFEVIEEHSGKRVAAQIRQHDPVACIIDIIMEEKEGIETIMEIVGLPQPPKIIATSSNNHYLELAFDLGADGVLQKPITPDMLALKLREIGVLADTHDAIG